jgi:hypothetical protein
MAKYMTPEDVAEEKASKKAEKAYNKAMPKADTTFGELADYQQRGRLGFTRAEVDKIKANAAESADRVDQASRTNAMGDTYKKGGKVSASSRADGCAQRGKTRGKMV